MVSFLKRLWSLICELRETWKHPVRVEEMILLDDYEVEWRCGDHSVSITRVQRILYEHYHIPVRFCRRFPWLEHFALREDERSIRSRDLECFSINFEEPLLPQVADFPPDLFDTVVNCALSYVWFKERNTNPARSKTDIDQLLEKHRANLSQRRP